jgi:hypothetical protein
VSRRPILSITIPVEAWLADHGRDRMIAVLVIDGIHHHLEALRVERDSAGIQRATRTEDQASLDAMFTIGHDGPFDTIAIGRAEYVIVVTPYQ